MSYCTFLPIRVVLQPFIRVVSECQFVRIIELSACCWVETRTVRLFTVMTWRWLNCLLFLMYVCCLCFVFFPPLKSMLISWFRFVWLLTMSWLNASKSYTNWTIKELLNGENVFLSFLPVKVDQTQRNLSSGEAKSREQKHSGVIIRAKSQLFVFSLSDLEREFPFCSCW